MNINTLSCTLMHDALVRCLKVDSLEVCDDENNFIEKPHFYGDKKSGVDRIYGKKFIFTRNGQRFGLRLDPIIKSYKIEPSLLDRFFGDKTVEGSKLDEDAIIQELERILNESRSIVKF